jgi:hypothetical protein
MNIAKVPTPAPRTWTPALPPCENMPHTSAAKPAAIAVTAMNGVAGESRELGIVAPSRSTATGGTRVARTAGTMPAATVTATPTSRLTSTVRTEKTSPA